ncbi:HyaD/HybD family hydrogenase maturation endopeptidase [Jiella marina]|uniref:HyaD/HybD family hydrogenase maturation endopeptidase n=1 Tax=Jiella sp. LLJ827 TaxID=2917712 RepID=UPI0021018E88|nr:HyaD/HybD family hydrogenase maturation endopeptidase [Jiella sp. LLJ827]MCQ0988212.1 HyaD/HybD family hydrogenase maturation endopeptidase [Jiella sp. LLJ827]
MDDPKGLVLGIGNLLWADEGFGVRAVEAFAERYQTDEDVRVMDGGTQGVYLLPFIQVSRVLVILDAIDYGLAPGTLKVVAGSKVPSFLGAKKMSLHQTGFQEVLASAALLGWEPEHVVLIGVQPLQIEDYGGSLSGVVAAAIEPAVRRAAEELRACGFAVSEKASGEDSEPLGPSALQLAAYEAGRPPEDIAWRHGDIRFVPMKGA